MTTVIFLLACGVSFLFGAFFMFSKMRDLENFRRKKAAKGKGQC